MKQKKYVWQGTIIAVLGGCGMMWYLCFMRTFTPTWKEPIIIEYGQEEITKDDILESIPENDKIELAEVPQFDVAKVDEPQDITISLKKGLRKQETTIPIKVKDTKPPVIEFVEPEIDIPYGDETKDAEDNIIEIKDPVDGPIENIQRGSLQECNMFLRNRMMKRDCVFIGTDFDVQIYGDYEVKVVSYDKSANMTIRSFTIHVMDSNSTSNQQIRSIIREDEIRLKENDRVYHNSLDTEYVPLTLLFHEQTLYQTLDAAQIAKQTAKQQGKSMNINTIHGIYDNHGVPHNYYVLIDAQFGDDSTNRMERNTRNDNAILDIHPSTEEKTETSVLLNTD